MELSRKFEILENKCGELPVPRSVRDYLRSRLKFFRLQALSDTDRQVSSRVIADSWQEFATEVRSLKLLDEFRKDQEFWREIAVFVGEHRIDRIKVGLPKPPAPDRPPSWEMDTFFLHLLRSLPKTGFKSAEEKNVVTFGLRYLYLEAQRGRGKRDKVACKETWFAVWPALERLKLLAKFKADENLKNRLRFFFEDRF